MENSPNSENGYDTIQVLDNPLPVWWKWTFLTTIVFSIFYALYFHTGGPGRTLAEKYETAAEAISQAQLAGLKGELKPDQDTILKYANDPSWVKVGQSVFKSNCTNCHGRQGEGKNGPNLTDDFYKNVSKVEDIARVISKGGGNGAMPAWSSRLKPNEIVLTASYVASLRGKKPSGEAKAAEGNEIAPWPAPPPPEPDVKNEDKSKG